MFSYVNHNSKTYKSQILQKAPEIGQVKTKKNLDPRIANKLWLQLLSVNNVIAIMDS